MHVCVYTVERFLKSKLAFYIMFSHLNSLNQYSMSSDIAMSYDIVVSYYVTSHHIICMLLNLFNHSLIIGYL